MATEDFVSALPEHLSFSEVHMRVVKCNDDSDV